MGEPEADRHQPGKQPVAFRSPQRQPTGSVNFGFYLKPVNPGTQKPRFYQVPPRGQLCMPGFFLSALQETAGGEITENLTSLLQLASRTPSEVTLAPCPFLSSSPQPQTSE